MRRFAILFLLGSLSTSVTLLTCGLQSTWAEDAPTNDASTIEGMQPVMISLADREPPSEEEWEALQEGNERGLFDSLTNVKSSVITFMDTRYFTPNCAEGTLASFGKMDKKNRFDRYGQIAGVSFDITRNSWKERYVLNAAALLQLAGEGRFVQFAGVEVDTAVQDHRQIEVTFVGTTVPKDEAIRRLNADCDALDYLGTLHEKRAQYDRKAFKLPGGAVPPQPKIVLANVMMLEGKSSKALEGAVGAKASSVIHGVGGEIRLVKQGSQTVTLLTPVVRCYRTYSIEFKTHEDGSLERVTRTDKDGKPRKVPVVFDVTPDL